MEKGRTDRTFRVMVWGCICYNGVRTLTKVEGNINADKYTTILEDNTVEEQTRKKSNLPVRGIFKNPREIIVNIFR
jgi:hypothetical protein